MRMLVGSLLICLGACGSRTESPAVEGADSVTATAMPDSVQSDSNQIIGHDSAFGPLFSVDSAGNRVDLPRRAP